MATKPKSENKSPPTDTRSKIVDALMELAAERRFEDISVRDISKAAGVSLAAAMGSLMFKPEEPSPPVTPEREATRQLLNDEERKMVAAMERDLVRPLTEEEERLVLEPGPLIEQPPPK